MSHFSSAREQLVTGVLPKLENILHPDRNKSINCSKHPKTLNKISLFCCCSPKSNLQDCQTPDQIHLARAVFYFMSTAAVARTGGGRGQLANIKSEGYGSQLAPAGLDCHLAQINREVSHSTEPTRLSENS